MEIEAVLNVSKDEILDKKHNLWIGLSLDNKKFTDQYIADLIAFGLKYTKDTLLIEIPGRLHANNLRYIEKLSRAEALRIAFEIEDEKRKFVKNIVRGLNGQEAGKIIVANYDDVLTPTTIRQREVLMREFSRQQTLYDRVVEISRDTLILRGRTVSGERTESVALYVLEELPLFLDGVQKNATPNIHTVVLYPGLGKVDELVLDILYGNNFSELRDNLDLRNKVGIASVI